MVNGAYAARHGFEYHTDLSTRTDRPPYWEKPAFFLEFLPSVEDGSLVIWEDVDSLNVGTADLREALPDGELMGMVPVRFSSNKIRNYFNAGVIMMINCAEVRAFWERVVARFDRHRQTEPVIVEELRSRKWEFCKGKKVFQLDVKWNVWKNNAHLCDAPEILSWHSIKDAVKIVEMREYLTKNPS